jgi:hypothetical protein
VIGEDDTNIERLNQAVIISEAENQHHEADDRERQRADYRKPA